MHLPIQPSAAAGTRTHRTGKLDTALLALFLVNIVCLVCYLFWTYQLGFHSDSAVANLYAQEIYETRSFIPADWNFVNHDLWTLFKHVWILPLLPFAANGFTLHAISTVIGCALFFASTWALLSVLGASRRARLVTLVVLSAGFSPFMSEHLYGQQAYGTIFFMSSFLLYGAWIFIHSSGRKQALAAIGILALTVLAAWANPQRAVMYSAFPVIAGVVALQAQLMQDAAERRRHLKPVLLLVLMLVAIGLGAVLHKHSFASNLSPDSRLAVNWLGFDGMGASAGRALEGLLMCLGANPVAGEPVVGIKGMTDALRLVSAAIVLLLAPAAVLRLLTTRSHRLSFFTAAAAVCLAASLFVYVTTTVPLGGNVEASVRYLVPGLLWAIVLMIVLAVDKIAVGPLYRLLVIPSLAVLALSAPISYGLVSLYHAQKQGGLAQVNSGMRLARFLEQQGLQYGYATFWNAGQVTVLSDSKVKVRQIEFHQMLPVPMRHLSSNRWYDPAAWQGPTFILLKKDEMALLDWTKLEALSGKPTRRLSFENVEVAVFDHNIARDYATWQVRVTGTRNYPITAYTPHAVGRFDPAQSRLTAEPGQAGTLHFGPYQRLAGGSFLVSFDLDAEGAGIGQFGHVDVVAESGQRELAKQLITRQGKHRITVPVRYDGILNGIEFRVVSNGAGKLSITNIEIAKNAQP